MIPVFILTYEGAELLDSWLNPNGFAEDIKIFIVDNGRQTFSNKLAPYVVHVTEKNIGCAGGYNLILDIGLSQFEKIVVAQDDGPFTESQIRGVYMFTDNREENSLTVREDRLSSVLRHLPLPPKNHALMGLFGYGFSFAIMGFSKRIRNIVGRFDENYLFGRREDNDLICRCKLAGIGIQHFEMQPAGKVSVIPNDYVMSFHENNVQYYFAKWGVLENFEHPFDHSDLSPFQDMPLSDKLIEVYGDIDEFPSVTEFKRFQEQS